MTFSSEKVNLAHFLEEIQKTERPPVSLRITKILLTQTESHITNSHNPIQLLILQAIIPNGMYPLWADDLINSGQIKVSIVLFG